MRSVHDMDRVPWWQQSIHPEVLILEAKDITFNTSLSGDVSQFKYEIQCRDLHGKCYILQLNICRRSTIFGKKFFDEIKCYTA